MKRKTAAASVAAILWLAACGGGIDSVPAPAAQKMPAPPAQALAESSTVVVSGTRGGFSLVRLANGFSITDRTGATPTVTIADAQAIRFLDITVNLTIADKAGTIPAADLQRLMELYVAFFNRVPEADGLAYWIDQVRGGMAIDRIADSFYAAALQYPSLTGYSLAMDNFDFVLLIYKNVLGRSGTTAPPDADVQYWSSRMGKGGVSKGELVRTMLDSAHSFAGNPTWGWVPQLLDNKIAVADYFAIQQGINFNTPDESIAKGMAIAAAVTPADTSTAKGLAGFADAGFNLRQVGKQ